MRRMRQSERGLVALGLALCTALVAAPTRAQLGSPVPLSAPAKPASAAAPRAPLDVAAARARIEQELARLRQSAGSDAAGAESPPPPGISPDEADRAGKAGPLLVVTYEEQLDSLKQIEEQRKARELAQQAERAWPGFPPGPPQAALLRDDLHEEADAHRAAADLLKASRGVIDLEFERLRSVAEQATEALRRAAAAAESAPAGSDARAAATWRLAAARRQAQLSAELLAASDLAARGLDEKLAVAQVQLQFAERKLAQLAGKATVDDADVEEATRRLEALRAQRDRELQALLAASGRTSREREQAAQALEALRTAAKPEGQSAERDRALLLAQARLRTADLRLQSLAHQVRIQSAMTNVYHGMTVESWSWRRAALADADAEARREARRRLAEMDEYLKLWASRSATEVQEVRAILLDQDQRVQAASDPEQERLERSAREAVRDLDLTLERQHEALARHLARLGHWQREFADVLGSRSLSDLGAGAWEAVKAAVQRIWNYELLAIEDKVDVDGRTVTTSRGITVGTSIGAVLLFILGYRLLAFLSKHVERLLVRRTGMDPEQAKTLRRWANALGLLALGLVTLNLARIPLTVFAFAGGALAIGLGFGTQTLIKNLISGMIVLVERHVRVGDIIEVEGVTGRVTAVDIRSSTVRGFDGVESMIPNAMLLEQKVTNWTLADANLRRVVKVGVAYGSPTREVERILGECANRHPAVLKDPAALVVLEDFGDNALIFGLYFWVNLTPSVSAVVVMSEIRFLIEERLGEAGIAMPFPQRDVHLDAAQPLKVQVVAGDVP